MSKSPGLYLIVYLLPVESLQREHYTGKLHYIYLINMSGLVDELFTYHIPKSWDICKAHET